MSSFITYPTRPISGGNLEYAGKYFGEWLYEPKYDGWRALIDIPNSKMWNRYGQPLSIESCFDKVIKELKKFKFEYLDVEALQRRHKIAQGSFIVLDIPIKGMSYSERRKILEDNFQILDVNDTPKPCSIYIPPTFNDKFELWNTLKNNPFYEGIVGKKTNSIYPIQTLSSDKEFNNWVKFKY